MAQIDFLLRKKIVRELMSALDVVHARHREVLRTRLNDKLLEKSEAELKGILAALESIR